MIKFDNFNFSYNKSFPIYKNLNLELESGKIHGLFGKNGAGKSTLLKNITGLNSPTGGSVLVHNKIPKERKPSFLCSVFMVPEEVHIPPISQMNFIKTYASLYPKFSFDLLCEYLNKLDVPETKKLNKLSFGQKKKFIIAFALACNTEVVIMDEPTNGLDIPSKSLFRKLINSTISKEKTFIISTHQVRDLDNTLDQILIVDKGELILNASMDEISKKVSFKFYNTAPSNDNVIIIDEVTGGYAVMEKNVNQDDTKVNLEQLFNASILKSKEINSIFQSKF